MRGWSTVCIVTSAVVLFAGCIGAGDAGPDLPELTWAPTYTVTTTPLEPFELQGTNVFGYDATRPSNRALFVQNEDDMARRNVRVDGTWYTTDEGRGWTRYANQVDLDASSRAHRIQTWDLRGLVESASTAEWTGYELLTSTRVTANGRTETVTVHAALDGGRVVSASIDSPFDPESPYTVVAGGTLPFSIRAPATATLTRSEANDGDATARSRHAQIIGWIDDYRTQTGALPRSIDAQTLAVQRLGAAWPTNPFSNEAMRDADSSGHFIWKYCSAQNASYRGLGWDKSPIGESFGTGCSN